MGKYTEKAKSTLIIFLVLLMLYLWAKNMQLRFSSEDDDTQILDSNLWIFTEKTNSHTQYTANDEYFSPLSVTLVADGSAYTTETNEKLTEKIWENIKFLAKEVFSDTYVCSKATAEKWESALKESDYILVEFTEALPYLTICAFDNRPDEFCSGELCTVKKLLLFSEDANTVSALAKDGEENYFYFSAATSPSAAMIYDFNSNNITAYTVNKDFFDAQINTDQKISSLLPNDCVLTDEPARLNSVSVHNTVINLLRDIQLVQGRNAYSPVSDSELTKLLEKFDINPSTVGVYTDAEATLVFVNSNSRLTVSQNGVVEYALSQGTEAQITLSNLLESERTQFSSFEQVAAATAFLDKFKEDFIGEDTRLLLCGIRREGNQTVYTFGYYENLCRIVGENENYEISLTFDDRGLTAVSMVLIETEYADSSEEYADTLIKSDISKLLAVSLLKGDSFSDTKDFLLVYTVKDYGLPTSASWISVR